MGVCARDVGGMGKAGGGQLAKIFSDYHCKERKKKKSFPCDIHFLSYSSKWGGKKKKQF